MIAVPYHLCERGISVGRGPLRILESLNRACHLVEAASSVTLGGLNRSLAELIAQQPDPQLILAGSCNSALGVLAGISIRGISRVGIVWFDAHGDFNTPQTSISSSPNGMALAAAVGDCLPDLCAACGLAKSIAAENVVLVAARDLDPDEAVRLSNSVVRRAGVEGLAPALEALSTRADAVYLHIDLDVLDPAISPGVNCTTPGGLTPAQLLSAIREVFANIPVAAATIANYNPDRDKDSRTLKIACELADRLQAALHANLPLDDKPAEQ